MGARNPREDTKLFQGNGWPERQAFGLEVFIRGRKLESDFAHRAHSPLAKPPMNRILTDSLNDEPKSKARSPLHFLFRHPLSLETETSWFLLLGVLDLVMTTVLLNTGVAHEANPLARFFLFAGGLHGLIGYKFGLLTLAAVSAQIITLRRPRTAKAVLHTGIGVQFLVVAYSVTLLARVAL